MRMTNDYSSLPSSISVTLKALSGMIPVKGGRPLLGQLIRVIPLVAGTINKSWIKVCIVYSNKLYFLWKCGGMTYVSAYLKTSTIMLQQVVGGQRVDDLGPFGARVSRTKAGCPRIIPSLHRVRIRKGDASVVRAWMTMLSIY